MRESHSAIANACNLLEINNQQDDAEWNTKFAMFICAFRAYETQDAVPHIVSHSKWSRRISHSISTARAEQIITLSSSTPNRV